MEETGLVAPARPSSDSLARHRHRPSTWRGPVWWLLVLAIGLSAYGGWELYLTRQLDAHGVIARAEVVDVSGGRQAQLTATYEVAGRSLEASTGRYTDERAGDSIEIVYDETAPTRFQTADFAATYASDDFGRGLLGGAVISTTLALGLMAQRRARDLQVEL